MIFYNTCGIFPRIAVYWAYTVRKTVVDSSGITSTIYLVRHLLDFCIGRAILHLPWSPLSCADEPMYLYITFFLQCSLRLFDAPSSKVLR